MQHEMLLHIIVQHRMIQDTFQHVQVTLSYLEIYQEYCYDLLDAQRDGKDKTGLTRVAVMEDEEHEIQLKNLSLHRVASEESALNLVGWSDAFWGRVRSFSAQLF